MHIYVNQDTCEYKNAPPNSCFSGANVILNPPTIPALVCVVPVICSYLCRNYETIQNVMYLSWYIPSDIHQLRTR